MSEYIDIMNRIAKICTEKFINGDCKLSQAFDTAGWVHFRPSCIIKKTHHHLLFWHEPPKSLNISSKFLFAPLYTDPAFLYNCYLHECSIEVAIATAWNELSETDKTYIMLYVLGKKEE